MATDPPFQQNEETAARPLRPVDPPPLPPGGALAAAPDFAVSQAKLPALPADDPPPSEDEIQQIVQSRHDAPHRVLGLHPSRESASSVVRAFLPDATRVVVRTPGPEQVRLFQMRRVHPAGLFQATVPLPQDSLEYELLVETVGEPQRAIIDPYRFRAIRFSGEDDRLFTAGRHLRLSEMLGSHLALRDGIAGVDFAVWAPGARRVSVVGTFNGWDGRRHPMQRVSRSGIWELFLPGVGAGDLYKFEIKTPGDSVFLKSDPFATRVEPTPDRASIVHDLAASHSWGDGDWLRSGRETALRSRGVHAFVPDQPIPGEPGERDALLARVAGEGFTHLQIAPANDSGGSLLAWGRPFGTPEALMAFVDAAHLRGLGVLLDDAGPVFPARPGDLAWFDGTPLFEGGTAGKPSPAFDLSRAEVRSILLSIRAFWLDRCHLDGICADQLAASLLAPLLDDWRLRSPHHRLIVRQETGAPSLSPAEIKRIAGARHDDPYAVLGPHSDPTTSGSLVIRTMQPGALEVQALLPGQPMTAHRMRTIDPAGLFELRLPAAQAPAAASYTLRLFRPGGGPCDVVDPYALRDFTFGAADQHLFGEGNHYRIYDKLGAHPRTVGGVSGVTFATWAPTAEGVSVVGSFNSWDGRVHQMKRHGRSGVWEVFVPEIGEGELYKFEIRARNGHTFLKSDPYAFHTEVPPATASIVRELRGVHDWRDQAWIDNRRTSNPWTRPMSIYEVHLGSWMRDAEGGHLSYRQLAAKLVPYVKSLGFTHVELLPIAEHPFEPSWGYQVSNFYAPSARFGAPADLMEFVDQFHQNDIGVILDWVPGHFPKDAHALAWFDGTHLYEHADPRKGEHPDWGTLIFNYGRHEVENFLIANALFWLEMFHFDGLRVDAVASMLYLDYSRGFSGSWIPNQYGGKENLEAIEFIKHTNSILHARFPGVLMVAEESTSWPKVSRPADQGGLGFGFKWNMGWMHDVLAYMSVPPPGRKHHHNRLTFGIMYAFNENFILALSHDEVVHMKGSLLNKMPGDEWEKFANLRLVFTFMYAHPGKKLLFMGGEIGQESEWDHARGLDWRVLENKPNRTLGWLLRDLNHLYREEPALHQADLKAVGFEWLEVDNADENILAFLRKARDPRDALLFAANFSGVSRPGHRIGVPYPGTYSLLFDSNARRYGGFGDSERATAVDAEEIPWHGREFSIALDLPALSAVILRPSPPVIGGSA